MAEAYSRSLSGTTSRIAGAIVLLVGLASFAAFGLSLFYVGQVIPAADSVVFGILSPVLCVAGFRLLAGRSKHAGAILPRAFWFAIGVIFCIGAVFVAAITIYTRTSFVRFLLFSALMVGALGIQSIRIGVRAPSNNRWRGP